LENIQRKDTFTTAHRCCFALCKLPALHASNTAACGWVLKPWLATAVAYIRFIAVDQSLIYTA